MNVRLLLVLGLTGVALADDGSNREIDRTYQPKVGDHAVVAGQKKEDGSLFSSWAATASYHYRDYDKALAIKDRDAYGEMRRDGHVVNLAIGTDVLLLDLEQFPTRDDGVEISDAFVVRVLSGEFKGRKLYTPYYYVVRFKGAKHGDGKPEANDTSGQTAFEPDPGYRPTTGDKATVYAPSRNGKPARVVCGDKAADYFEYLELIRSDIPPNEMINQNRLFRVDSGTPIQVGATVGVTTSPFTGRSARVLMIKSRTGEQPEWKGYILEHYVVRLRRKDN